MIVQSKNFPLFWFNKNGAICAIARMSRESCGDESNETWVEWYKHYDKLEWNIMMTPSRGQMDLLFNNS